MNQKKNNTGKGILCLLGLLIVIAVCTFFAAGTLEKSKLVTDENGVTMFQEGGIKLGLDLAGGVSITYKTKIDEPSAEDMSDTQYKLMQRVQKSDVAVCLDIGHAHYSSEPMGKWFDVLGEYIQYMHLSDNMGKFDDHLPIGSGSIDWNQLNSLWKSLHRDMPATLEVGGIAGVEESLRYLRKNGYFGMEE